MPDNITVNCHVDEATRIDIRFDQRNSHGTIRISQGGYASVTLLGTPDQLERVVDKMSALIGQYTEQTQ